MGSYLHTAMKIIQIFCLLLLCPLAKAQDTILKTDQTEIATKVIEITADEVKFKYFNRLDGPTYTLIKSEVFVIIYKDGTREKFSPAASVASTVPALPVYTETPATRPTPTAPVLATSTYSPSTVSKEKRRGWTASLGYVTPLQGIGNASGINYGFGYYFLGPGRKGGVMLDLEAMNFFGEGTPNYGLLALNGMFRASETSKFYLGGGLGYATVSVDVITYDRYNLKKTTKVSSGDFGGKVFMGYGIFRAGITWPSFQRIEGGGLLIVGLYLNPFS